MDSQALKFEITPPAITRETVEAFRKATQSEEASRLPATFPTVYRLGEFQLISQLGVDMRNLLHTEQEYEYLKPLLVGDKPTTVTRLKETRTRKGKAVSMSIHVLETEVRCGSEVRVRCLTTFVVREPVQGAS